MVTIVTPEVEGASCTITDKLGAKWYVASTPESVMVRKGQPPLTIMCSKSGYKKAVVLTDAAWERSFYGNLLAGGPIGGFVDAKSGAGSTYPGEIRVWMEPMAWRSESERDDFLQQKRIYEQEKREAAHRCLFSHYTNC